MGGSGGGAGPRGSGHTHVHTGQPRQPGLSWLPRLPRGPFRSLGGEGGGVRRPSSEGPSPLRCNSAPKTLPGWGVRPPVRAPGPSLRSAPLAGHVCGTSTWTLRPPRLGAGGRSAGPSVSPGAWVLAGAALGGLRSRPRTGPPAGLPPAPCRAQPPLEPSVRFPGPLQGVSVPALSGPRSPPPPQRGTHRGPRQAGRARFSLQKGTHPV